MMDNKYDQEQSIQQERFLVVDICLDYIGNEPTYVLTTLGMSP